MISVFIAFLVTTYSVQADTECPSNFVKLHNNCYYFSTATTDMFGAMVACHGMNAELLSIESVEENFALETHLYYKKVYPHYWMSATDAFREGQFNWMSTLQKLTYTDWCPNQPDNYRGNEDCVLLWHFSKGGFCWNDTPCQNNWNYICEYELL